MDKLLTDSFELRYGEAHRRGLLGPAMVADLVRGLAWSAMADLPLHPSSAMIVKLEAAIKRLVSQLESTAVAPWLPRAASHSRALSTQSPAQPVKNP